MADNTDRNQGDDNPQPRAQGAAAGANVTESQRMKAQTGGEQSDQLSGETQRGAHNQDTKNRNPSGNNPDRNQSARQEGNDL